MAGIIKEAGEAGAGEGGLLGLAEGLELAEQVLGDVGGGVGEGGAEAAAGGLALSVEPGLVAVASRVAVRGRGRAGRVGSCNVVQEAFLQEQGCLRAGERGQVGR